MFNTCYMYIHLITCQQVFIVKISKTRCVLLIFIMYKHRADFCGKGIFFYCKLNSTCRRMS